MAKTVRERSPRPHILELITTLDPGGAEHQLLTLVGRLRERFRFTVGYLKGEGGLAPRFAALGVAPLALRIRGRLDPVCLVRLAALLRRLRPDLVVTHLFKADVYGAAAAAGTGIPVLSHKHNEDQYLLHPFYGALARAVARRAERQVAVSAAVVRFYVERAGFPAARMVIVRHGIEIEAAREDPGEVRRRWGAEPGGVLIGTAARLTAQKGLDILVAAARRLVDADPRIRVVIAGRGEEAPRLAALVERTGLAGKVQLAGHVADIPALLGALDVFVLPSRWEGFGIVLLEAMAHGCPVVATRVGGIPEVITHGVTGLLVPPEDPRALADAVLALLRDAGRQASLRRAARAAFERRFTAARMAAETAALYEEAIRTGGAP
ncbi:MAG: glycosyltransferase [Planctomycetes bacterium]|nr:glycosyltransferase [Planctomycetota bacterium]